MKVMQKCVPAEQSTKSAQTLSRVARWHREGPAGDAVALDTLSLVAL